MPGYDVISVERLPMTSHIQTEGPTEVYGQLLVRAGDRCSICGEECKVFLGDASCVRCYQRAEATATLGRGE